MSEALVSSDILYWARQRAKMSIEQLAESIKVKVDKVQKWEDGEKKPTFTQAQKLAKVFQIPFGYLFLKNPPTETLAIPDLRTFDNRPISTISPNFRILLNNIEAKQEWYKEYILENDLGKKEFLEKFNLKSDKELLINDITINLNLQKYIAKGLNPKNFLEQLTEEIRNLDILVMKGANVANATRKKLDLEEFRGFAIYDVYAPLIFINTADSYTAQLFTLLHEVVHLWIGKSGISPQISQTNNEIEFFCNEIVGEILMPKSLVQEDANYEDLAKKFSVSTQAMLTRMYFLKLINADTYKKYTEIEKEKFLEIKETKRKSSGGNFYYTLKSKIGENFSYALLGSLYEGKISYKDTSYLLDVSPTVINNFAKELKIVR